MPEYFFARRNNVLSQFIERIEGARHIYLFLDYDGTVVPIRKTPGRAVLSTRVQNTLIRLARSPGVTVCVVTGRSLADIRRMVQIPRLALIANHGFEICSDGAIWIHPGAIRLSPRLMELYAALRRTLDPIRNVLVENKWRSVSVHYRNVDGSKIPRVRSIVQACAEAFGRSFRITQGKKVVEIRPNIRWDKGRAVLRFLSRKRIPAKSLILYFGDDVTDEDAFNVLVSKAITVKVGHFRSTFARYYVRNPDEVRKMLNAICAARQKRPS